MPRQPSAPDSQRGSDDHALKVILSSHYQGYTDGRGEVSATGRTVEAVLEDLDRQFPGLRFRLVDEQGRLRRHVNVFVNDEVERNLGARIRKEDVLSILGALSGG